MLTWPLLLTPILLAAAPEFSAQSLDGRAATGRILDLSSERLVLETAQGRMEFPIDALATLTGDEGPASQESNVSIWLELIDGSKLAVADYSVSGAKARIKLTDGRDLEISTRSIRWVRFHPASEHNDKLDRSWAEALRTKMSGDLLVVRKNDVLDFVEGTAKDVDGETCKFEIDKDAIPVKRAKIEGIIYFRAVVELPAPLASLVTRVGARLAIGQIGLKEDRVALTTPTGLNFEVPLADVTRLDFSSGKIVYLSDLEPESAAYTPFWGFKEPPQALAELYQYRRDKGFEGQPLKLDGRAYRKGLAMRSRTLLTYKLPAKFRLFQAVVGIDDAVRSGGHVRLEIKADGKILWQGEIAGSEPAKDVELPLAGAKRLEILADYGDDLDIADRLDLGDARVIK